MWEQQQEKGRVGKMGARPFVSFLVFLALSLVTGHWSLVTDVWADEPSGLASSAPTHSEPVEAHAKPHQCYQHPLLQKRSFRKRSQGTQVASKPHNKEEGK
jgi:hypothetical protein